MGDQGGDGDGAERVLHDLEPGGIAEDAHLRSRGPAGGAVGQVGGVPGAVGGAPGDGKGGTHRHVDGGASARRGVERAAADHDAESGWAVEEGELGMVLQGRRGGSRRVSG